VYRAAAAIGEDREQEIIRAVQAQGGRIISRARIEEIAYHALLTDLPVAAVRRIAERAADGIAALDSVMHIRPQSVASGIEVAEIEDSTEALPAQAKGDPILALLDGVPVAAHKLLSDHLVVDDQFDLETDVPVSQRVHGTAMASLIIHG